MSYTIQEEKAGRQNQLRILAAVTAAVIGFLYICAFHPYISVVANKIAVTGLQRLYILAIELPHNADFFTSAHWCKGIYYILGSPRPAILCNQPFLWFPCKVPPPGPIRQQKYLVSRTFQNIEDPVKRALYSVAVYFPQIMQERFIPPGCRLHTK